MSNTNRFNPHTSSNEAWSARRRAIAAVDAMHRGEGRPLKPPPMPHNANRASSGALELAREIKRGHYTPAAMVLR